MQIKMVITSVMKMRFIKEIDSFKWAIT